MENYQKEFIEFALEHKALMFGEFKLNSGRISPYFFNAGRFNTGAAIAGLGKFYAQSIQKSGLEFDTLFGPAYKGITLVTTAAIALAEHSGIDKPYCFNRKEPKDHGEGGTIVGAPLQGRVLIVDDVISTGLTMQKVMNLIHQAGAQVGGIVILVDRQERGLNSNLSAVQEVEKNYQIPVLRVVGLNQIMNFLRLTRQDGQLELMREYQDKYGVKC
jgi:orotate phosphoribosyltransferase